MIEFTIENIKYRIDHSDIDELARFRQLDESTNKWSSKQVLESYDIGEGKLHANVRVFMDKFIGMVNKTLEKNHGKVDSGTDFKNPIEELKYRIDNNLKVEGSEVKVIPW